MLKELVRLSERKEALMAQIQEVDREMLRLQERFGIPRREDEAPVTISRSGPRRRKSRS